MNVEEAKLASIAKWERNALVTDLKDATVSAYDCPLCTLFFHQFCRGCPVAAKTGKSSCNGTPYRRAVTAWWRRDLEAFRAAAREMVEFLKTCDAGDIAGASKAGEEPAGAAPPRSGGEAARASGENS